LISCLTTAEEVDLGLEREAEEARSTGLEFVRLPIDDRSTPEQQAVDDVVDSIAPKLAASVKIAVHCRQGLGRAPLVAGAILVRMGLSADEAWASIEGGRGQPVPDTQEQSEWLRRFASRSGL
jgi:protein-tyrosine phosphatase